MSTFESSSRSVAAPVAAPATLRKTQNHRNLFLSSAALISPSNRRYLQFDDCASDEEEERIRVALVDVDDEDEICHSPTPRLNVTIQLGVFEAVRNAARRVKKSALRQEVRSFLLIFAIFFVVVVFGGANAASSSASSSTSIPSLTYHNVNAPHAALLAPSGRPMRFPSASPSTSPNNDASGGKPNHSMYAIRAARAASVYPSSSHPLDLQEAVLPPSNPTEQKTLSAPSGVVSAKFYLLYRDTIEEADFAEGGQSRHPENLAELFHGVGLDAPRFAAAA